MKNSHQDKIEILLNLYEAKYSGFEDNAKVAAKYAMSDFMNTCRHQMKYFESLLDEEIEDLKKAQST